VIVIEWNYCSEKGMLETTENRLKAVLMPFARVVSGARSIWNGRMSARLSVPSIDSSSMRRVCSRVRRRQEILIDIRRRRSAATALSGKCGQCHVDSGGFEAEHRLVLTVVGLRNARRRVSMTSSPVWSASMMMMTMMLASWRAAAVSSSMFARSSMSGPRPPAVTVTSVSVPRCAASPSAVTTTHTHTLRLSLSFTYRSRRFCTRLTVSWYQKGKTSLDFNQARDDGVLAGSGISRTICKQSAPRSR